MTKAARRNWLVWGALLLVTASLAPVLVKIGSGMRETASGREPPNLNTIVDRAQLLDASGPTHATNGEMSSQQPLRRTPQGSLFCTLNGRFWRWDFPAGTVVSTVAGGTLVVEFGIDALPVVRFLDRAVRGGGDQASMSDEDFPAS